MAVIKSLRWAVLGVVSLGALVCGAAAIRAVEVPTSESMQLATTPDDRLDQDWWKKRHEEKLALAKEGGWDVAFIGDSITHGWEGHGKETWAEFYGDRKAINLGYSGDRTEHVLWRLDHGELDGYQPKVAVIMIGTNNTGHRRDAPQVIATGVIRIVQRIQEKSPKTKVLLLGIFPRSAEAADPQRENNDLTNGMLEKIGNDETVVFLNINDAFLTEDGVLTKEVMPDLLHPEAAGYKIWAEAMEPTLAKLLGE
jgi:lysophospholipase L1-like esterase